MSRPLLLGGVALASVLGAGVGLWARPNAVERPGAVARAVPTASPARADRRLAIVVDDRPAPLGKPLEVLAPSPPRPAIAPPAPSHVEAPPVAHRPAPNALVRVAAPVPGPLAPALGHKALPVPASVVVAAEKPAKPETKAAPARRNPVAKARTLDTAKLQKASAKAKPDKARARKTEVAEAGAKGRHGLSALAHAFAKLAPSHAKTTERADAAPPRHSAAEARLAKVEPAREKPPAAAPIKVSAVQTRCASSDPGEALVCGDPGLSAADRRLSRAYHDAEAAGVPSATLERQQQRWRAARAAAAREAPWAVRQVYQARIAELQDQARDARGD